MTFILSFDTTSKHVSIALSQAEEIRLEYNFLATDDLTSSLLPALDFVLNSASLKLQDVDVLGITIGPGLFTGIRVGLATLKGLLFASGKPIVPVTSLAAIANKYSDANKTIVSLLDARRDEVYAALYHFVKGRVTEIKAPALLHISGLKDFVQGHDSFYFAGSGAEVHRELLEKQFPGQKIKHRSYFLASEVCKIAAWRYAENDTLKNVQDLLPLYIRKPDAEQNLLPQ